MPSDDSLDLFPEDPSEPETQSPPSPYAQGPASPRAPLAERMRPRSLDEVGEMEEGAQDARVVVSLERLARRMRGGEGVGHVEPSLLDGGVGVDRGIEANDTITRCEGERSRQRIGGDARVEGMGDCVDRGIDIAAVRAHIRTHHDG